MSEKTKNKAKLAVFRIFHILPVVICFFFMLYFNSISNSWQEANHARLHQEKIRQVDLLNGEVTKYIERDQDWDKERSFYIEWMAGMMEGMDAQDHTLAIMLDDKLELISSRDSDVDGEILDPTKDEHFIREVRHNDRGEVSVYHAEDDVYINLYYKWVPDTKQDERFLLVIGVSPATADNFQDRFFIGAAAMSVTVVIMQAIMISYVTILRKMT